MESATDEIVKVSMAFHLFTINLIVETDLSFAIIGKD